MNKHTLRTLIWEATLRCNARCEFCGSRCGEYDACKLEKEELTGEEILSCFREVADRYDAHEIMINVTGGEPLLRKDLFDVMAKASQIGFPWGMVTNGTMITEEIVRNMKSSGMKTISISLDGLKDIHDNIRKLQNGYEKVIRAVSLLKKADFLDELQITTVVNHQNIGELEALFLQICDMGVDTWRIVTVDPIGRAEGQKDLLLTRDDYAAYFLFFRKHQFNGKVILSTGCSHYFGSLDNLYRNHDFTCRTGKQIAGILANGDIFVCPNVERRTELIQGNIKKDSFCDRWENGFEFFRDENRQKHGTCEACADRNKCRGDSLHTWNFEKQEPNFCWRKQTDLVKMQKTEEQEIGKLVKPYHLDLTGMQISYGNSSGFKVYILPQAAEELRTYFGWGRKDPRNQYELFAGLAGHMTEQTVVVEALIPSRLEYRSENQAVISDDNEREILEELAIMNRCKNSADQEYQLFSSDYCLVGTVHSHPGELDPIMSLPDMKSHEGRLKENPYFVTMILNPQKRRLCAWYNSLYRPVDLEILTEHTDDFRW